MKTSAKGYIQRFIMLTLGLMVAAYGVTMTVNAGLGVSPWDVFAQGTANKLSDILGREILMGTTTQWIGWIVLILSVALKEKIGFGTIYDILIVGNLINFYMSNSLVPMPQTFALKLALLIEGFVVWSFGVYLYLAAELGAGPRDGLMAALSKKGINVAIAKNSIEAVVLVIGWLMGGTVGLGTVIAVFAMGYLIRMWFAIFKFDLAKAQNESIVETLINIKRLIVK